MKDCIFLPAENAQGCLVERARRFREHRPDLRPWERNPCENCKTGTARAEAAGPPKEEEVEQAKVKENILRVLGRKGSMTISNLKLFAGKEETKENFRAAVEALAREGKINTKQGVRAGTLHVALPGAPAPSNDATIPSKTPRSVNRASATPPSKTRAKAKAPVPAPREPAGNGVYAAVIDDLEARRAKIDQAIELLRAISV